MLEKLIKSENCGETEKDEIAKIMNCIYKFNSFVVRAGAGAGKTYSLIETITNVLKTKNKVLTQNNQNILCITYTNAAVDEIKNRIGNTSLVKVSTIHEFLWDTIKNYQQQLIEEHIIKIRNKIAENDRFLEESGYDELSDQDKEELKEKLLTNAKNYYQINHLKADEFRGKLSQEFERRFHSILNNINNFKSIANKILSNDNLSKTIEKIDNKEKNYLSVDYDANINTDRLPRMKISHDTLLEYSRNLVAKYELLRLIVIDRYPYILVDEFQDTSPVVIDMLNDLEKYKKEKSKKFLIGFFGDEAQNIYDTGIGNQLDEKIEDLTSIQKKYNYRSSKAVIKLANFTRLDELKQETAYTNPLLGQTNFINLETENNQRQTDSIEIIERYKEKWKISKENNLGIFLTMNRYLSSVNEFEELFNFYRSSPYYRINWEQLSQEVLSLDTNKLGTSPKKLYDILYFRNIINNENTAISELISEKILYNVNYLELKNIVNKLLLLKETLTISDFIKTALSLLQNTEKKIDKKRWASILEKYFSIDSNSNITYESIVDNLIKSLILDNTSEDNSDNLKNEFNQLIEGPIEPFINWFNYITSNAVKETTYSTIHGTKGNEYDNVIVVLENDFGSRNRDYFKNAITKIVDQINLNPINDSDNILGVNLLYVASTRARKNITFLYFGEITTDEKETLKSYVDNYYENVEDIG